MVKQYKKRLLFCVLLIVALVPYSRHLFSGTSKIKFNSGKKAIIFDIGGVLARTRMKAAFAKLGAKPLTAFCMLDWKSPNSLKTTLYAFLDSISDKNNQTVSDPHGDQIPYLFYEVLTGARSEQETLKLVLENIEKNPEFFCSKREQELCAKVAKIMFDHEMLIELQEEISEGVEILHACRDQGHEIFIFSNYGKLAFAELKKKFPHIFQNIPNENIVISAHIGAAKPELEAYKTLRDRMAQKGISTELNTCFFIDNQQENLNGTALDGINGVHVKNRSFRLVKEALGNHNII